MRRSKYKIILIKLQFIRLMQGRYLLVWTSVVKFYTFE